VDAVLPNYSPRAIPCLTGKEQGLVLFPDLLRSSLSEIITPYSPVKGTSVANSLKSEQGNLFKHQGILSP
jgi:hypothetical protein